jgi:hypothetical protein
MRNLFDQYDQPENRLTHALVCVLRSDGVLLRKFVKWATGDRIERNRPIEVLEQQLPGEEEVTDELEVERKGLPDAWIHDGDGWALLIESKIQATLRQGQLDRHRRTAERRGFSQIRLIAFVPQRHQSRVFENVRIFEWAELYLWMRGQDTCDWARRLTEYMEVLEQKLADRNYLKEGTMTVFSGIPFGRDCPYNYHEAKRLLHLALNQIRQRREFQKKLHIDPNGKGRPAITGREGSGVWDFLPLAASHAAKSFTQYPHLTMGIQRDRLIVIVTIPNGIRPEFRRNLLAGGEESFLEVFETVFDNLRLSLGRIQGAAPFAEIIQRHYPSQRSTPITDARLEFDLRTAFRGSKRWRKPVKRQPEWLRALYEALSGKRSNLQFAVGVLFPYERCEAVHSPEILDHVANVWIACRPLIKRTLG